MDPYILRQLEPDTTFATRAIANEWALVQRAIAGETNAMELLFAPHMSRLYRVALAILRNKEDAEDALQDGLYKAYSCLGSFQGRSSFSTWLTRIVMNSALMNLRKRRSHSESSLDEVGENQAEWLAPIAVDKRPNPKQVCALIELYSTIEDQMLKLPASEQAAFRFYAINGHSIMESCQALGVSETTIKSRIFRTRRKLAHGLQHRLGEACSTSSKGNSSHVAQR